jgi:hypothetical protein
MFTDKNIASGFDFFAEHEFRRLVKKKVSKEDA